MRDRGTLQRALRENLSGLSLLPEEARRRSAMILSAEPIPRPRQPAAWLVAAALTVLLTLMPFAAAGERFLAL
ncbi:MAG: hypothetical protein IKH38_01865 [Clostridia bacterium]|nr:hypothetical protein [Clostridia bacterium]